MTESSVLESVRTPVNKSTSTAAPQYSQEIYDLFDQYIHGRIDRRTLMKDAGKLVVSVAALNALMEAFTPNFAEAQQVSPKDERLQTEYIKFDSPKGYGTVHAYMARPAKVNGKLPVILVIHENRGLSPHIEDVTRRVALEGYIAMAPDALYPLGGYPSEGEDKARIEFRKLDQTKTIEDFIVAAERLKNLPEGNGKLGVVGFCYGGTTANLLASKLPYILAAVPYYGGAAQEVVAANIKARLLIHFAENDPYATDSWPGYEAALKAAGVKYEAYTYKGAQHGFNNDTSAPRYNKEVATLAWQRTMALFNSTLR